MNKKYSFKYMLTLVCAASAFACIILTMLFYAYIMSLKEEENEFSDFEELLRVIENRFIGAYDTDDIITEAMRAAVKSLDDDWSYYMSPDEYMEHLSTANNRYTGIGVEVLIDEETEGMKVLGVYKDSGADLAGIVVDDIVVAIDGESIIGLTLDEIRDMLRREIGDSAVITVLKPDGDHIDLIVVYSYVFRDPVSFRMLGNIGYIELKNFEEGAAHRFISAVNELINEGAVAFIYDVRSNPGGRVGEVTLILDFLLPAGEIFIAVDRSGVEQITKSNESFIDIPAVVVINKYSYSGAEYFAAMLSEYEYAETVGEQTTGKNRMQTTIELSNGGAVHISTAHYLTKNRVSLFEAGGYTPDHIVELTEDEWMLFRRWQLDIESDPQVQKALSLLENHIN